jgi:hypothetical protein
VTARTWLKEISPRAIAALVSGSLVSARATRTRSRAVTRFVLVACASQSAHERREAMKLPPLETLEFGDQRK